MAYVQQVCLEFGYFVPLEVVDIASRHVGQVLKNLVYSLESSDIRPTHVEY